MDVRIPFQIPAKRRKNTDETRSKKLGLIVFVKHASNHTVDSRKEEIQNRTVFQKEETS